MARKKSTAAVDTPAVENGEPQTERRVKTDEELLAGIKARREKMAEWRRTHPGEQRSGERPRYIVIGVLPSGVQQVLHVAISQHQCNKWLEMAHQLLLQGYQSVSVFRGKPVILTGPEGESTT